ncbi:hypothetical protein D3C77_391860 [compost metagenome]
MNIRIFTFEGNTRRYLFMLHCKQHLDYTGNASRCCRMPDIGLHGTKRAKLLLVRKLTERAG